MPDPASTLGDLEDLLAVPADAWPRALAPYGVTQPECEGVEAAQGALRQALADGGTHHDVLGRMRRSLHDSLLADPARRTALGVLEVARAASRRRLALALSQFAAHAAGPRSS